MKRTLGYLWRGPRPGWLLMFYAALAGFDLWTHNTLEAEIQGGLIVAMAALLLLKHPLGERSVLAWLPRAFWADLTSHPSGRNVRQVETDEPIQAWKRVQLTPDGSVVSAMMREAIGVGGEWDTARCSVLGGHDAPDLGCTCGFYAVTSRKSRVLTDVGGMAGRVELAGRVYSDADGVMRATHQRLLGVYVDPLCHWCGGPADGLAVYLGTMEPTCAVCWASDTRLTLPFAPLTGEIKLVNGAGQVVWVARGAEEQLALSFRNELLSWADATAKFGVEIRPEG